MEKKINKMGLLKCVLLKKEATKVFKIKETRLEITSWEWELKSKLMSGDV